MKFKYYLRGAGFGIITATIILTIAFLFQDPMTDAEIMRRASELGMVMGDGGNTPETLADVSKDGASQADLETGTEDGTGDNPDAGTPKDSAQAGGSEPDADPDADPDNGTGQAKDDQSGQDSTEKKNTSADVSDKTDTPDKNADQDSDQTDADKSDDNKSKDDKDSSSKTQDGSSDKKQTKDDSNSNDNKDNKDTGKDTDKAGSGTQDGQAGNAAETADGKVIITIEAGDVSRIVSGKVKDAGLVEDQAEFNAYLGANGYDNQLQPGSYEIEKGSSFRQIADILTSR